MWGRKAKRIRDLERQLQHAQAYIVDLIADVDKRTAERDALAKQFEAFCDQLERRLSPKPTFPAVKPATLASAQVERQQRRAAGGVPMCIVCPHERTSHDSNGCMEGACRCEVPYHRLVTVPGRLEIG